jgi:glycosyltransferase involved in cell wall biosynthesis
VPKVSVITAAYNAEAFIVETVESVLGQTYRDFEVIVVDDGSTDGTAGRLEPYTDRLRYVRQDNRGASAARNRAVAEASGDYLAVVDADDIWLPTKLERQMGAISDADGLCYTQTDRIDVHGAVIEPALVRAHPPLTCLAALTGGYPVVNSSMLLNRRFLDPRPYPEDVRHAEDLVVAVTALARSGGRSVYLDESLVRYRDHPGSRLGSDVGYQRGFENMLAYTRCAKSLLSMGAMDPDEARRVYAFTHWLWARFCIGDRSHRLFSLGELLRAVSLDPVRQIYPAGRQVAKMGLLLTGWGRGRVS